MIFPIFILTLISACGLLLFIFKKVNRTFLDLLIGLGAGSMLSVSLVHIFPEALEQTELAVYAFVIGFLVIYLIEEVMTSHTHDHMHGGHKHEDPHEHYDHVAFISFVAIFIHTLFDGLGIRAGFGLSPEIGYTVLAWVAIHQIPVSLSLAAIFRDSKFRRNTQILFLIFFAFAAAIGYIISDNILRHVSPIFTGLTTAFAGGSLLYVATADLLPLIHAQSRNKYGTIIFFLIGCIGMMAVKMIEK